MRDIITDNPSDISARLAMQNIIDAPSERYDNMRKLLEIGAKNRTRVISFGREINDSELLATPEAAVFFDFIRDTANNAQSEAARSAFSEMLPITNAISEKFSTTRLFDNWIPLGSSLSTLHDNYELKASVNMTEAYLRLKRSELMRDGYIEADLGESVGAFWLYARRSARSMVRFGFTGDGYLRIQAWKDGEIRSSDSVAWIRPPGTIRFRLEIRGNGAVGIVDGKEPFSTPLAIPDDIAYGWWAIAPFSSELGMAKAKIEHVAAGPLIPSIILMQSGTTAENESSLVKLRDNARNISALSPILFTQASDGTIHSTPDADMMPYRMFTSYHRIRFLPAVALDYYSEVKPESIIKLIENNRIDGLVLIVRSLPPESWFDQMKFLLEKNNADLILIKSEVPVRSQNEGSKAVEKLLVREIECGNVIIQPNQKEWNISAMPFEEWKKIKPHTPGCIPTVVIMTKPNAEQ